MVTAADLPCYAIYHDDFHMSDAWGNAMVDLWINTRRALREGKIKRSQFRKRLIDGIIEASDWRACFRQAAKDVGADPEDEGLFARYVRLHRASAFNLLPAGLHAELAWIPEWKNRSGWGLDELIDTHGLRSTKARANYIDDIEPGHWLKVFLRFIGVGSDILLKDAWARNQNEGDVLAARFRRSRFRVAQDAAKEPLMTGSHALQVIENASPMAVPVVHCEINVRALFELPPGAAIRLAPRDGKLHLGLHDYLNGSGYMDTCFTGAREIIIPKGSAGFVGASRWRYPITSTYGLVRRCFHVTPTAA